jgi:transcriptional regulator with XRE-family HTH domain
MPIATDPQTAKKVISNNIRKCLRSRGWNVRNLVLETNEPHNTVYRVCRGDNEPRVALLANIAEALRVTVDSLLDDQFSPKFRKRK